MRHQINVTWSRPDKTRCIHRPNGHECHTFLPLPITHEGKVAGCTHIKEGGTFALSRLTFPKRGSSCAGLSGYARAVGEETWGRRTPGHCRNRTRWKQRSGRTKLENWSSSWDVLRSER